MVTEFCTLMNLVCVSHFPNVAESLYIELLNVSEGAVFSRPLLVSVMAARTCPLQNKVSTSVGVAKDYVAFFIYIGEKCIFFFFHMRKAIEINCSSVLK